MKLKRVSQGLMTDFFDKAEFDKMELEQKKDFLRIMIRKTLIQNPPLSAIQISQALLDTPLRLIQPELDYLVSQREILMDKIGKTAIYSESFKLMHIVNQIERKMGGQTYCFTEIKNEHGHRILIQEVIKDENGHSDVRGGLVIPVDQLDNWIETLLDMNPKTKRIEYDDKCGGGRS